MFFLSDVNQFSIITELLGTPPDDVIETIASENVRPQLYLSIYAYPSIHLYRNFQILSSSLSILQNFFYWISDRSRGSILVTLFGTIFTDFLLYSFLLPMLDMFALLRWTGLRRYVRIDAQVRTISPEEGACPLQ